MGESTDNRTTLRFDRRLRLEFHGSTITSDAGLLACRELDDALGLEETATACLQESRGGRNVQHQLVALLRQPVYSRLAGYEDTNDAERLAQDPAMRVIFGRRGLERQAASTNTMSRFETEVLARKHNPEGLARMNARWVDRAMAHTSHRRVSWTWIAQRARYMGNRREQPTMATLAARAITRSLSSTSSGTARGPCCVLGMSTAPTTGGRCWHPIVARYRRTGVRRYFRADAAFAKPEVYEYLEERRILYAIRLPSNEVVQWEIAPLLRRPVGRPPKKPIIWYDDFWYQAGSWDRPRRVIAKVEWHQGELFPRVGFIVTNMPAGPEGVVHFYNGRGTAEQWIKEGKYALTWTRLSCHRFVANQVRLALFILAYNLGNLLRGLCLPRAVKHWPLRSLQVKLIKIGGEASSPRPAAGV